jgi:hypothetical protein
VANPRKMPNTNLSPTEYRRLYERLYYRRVYRAKKILQSKAWNLKNPEKVKLYHKKHKENSSGTDWKKNEEN